MPRPGLKHVIPHQRTKVCFRQTGMSHCLTGCCLVFRRFFLPLHAWISSSPPSTTLSGTPDWWCCCWWRDCFFPCGRASCRCGVSDSCSARCLARKRRTGRGFPPLRPSALHFPGEWERAISWAWLPPLPLAGRVRFSGCGWWLSSALQPPSWSPRWRKSISFRMLPAIAAVLSASLKRASGSAGWGWPLQSSRSSAAAFSL